MLNFNQDIINRFWSKVDKSSGCWNWKSTLVGKGYGKFWINHTSQVRAHRFSWMLHFGNIPEGFLVCHKCDNPKCINPDHLFLGTAADNLHDMVVKGRSLKGEKHSLVKLTEQEVIEIKHSDLSSRKLANKYSVSRGTITSIKKGKSWQWLDG